MGGKPRWFPCDAVDLLVRPLGTWPMDAIGVLTTLRAVQWETGYIDVDERDIYRSVKRPEDRGMTFTRFAIVWSRWLAPMFPVDADGRRRNRDLALARAKYTRETSAPQAEDTPNTSDQHAGDERETSGRRAGDERETSGGAQTIEISASDLPASRARAPDWRGLDQREQDLSLAAAGGESVPGDPAPISKGAASDRSAKGATAPPRRTKPGETGDAFDFEAVYQRYPRKEGKSAGLKTCRKQIKTQAQYEQLGRAIDAYAAKVRREATETQFIKHFSTFMGEWKDWIPQDAPPPAAEAPAAFAPRVFPTTPPPVSDDPVPLTREQAMLAVEGMLPPDATDEKKIETARFIGIYRDAEDVA